MADYLLSSDFPIIDINIWNMIRLGQESTFLKRKSIPRQVVMGRKVAERNAFLAQLKVADFCWIRYCGLKNKGGR